jgi:hypothetical protein
MERRPNFNLIFICIVVVIILTGCSNNKDDKKYFESASNFNNIYFEVAEFIDSNRLTESIESLQSQANKEKMNELSTLIVNIEKSMPQERKILYDSFKTRYDDLVYIQNIYGKINNLGEEEKRKIHGIFISINLDKKDWEDKNSKRVWE